MFCKILLQKNKRLQNGVNKILYIKAEKNMELWNFKKKQKKVS